MSTDANQTSTSSSSRVTAVTTTNGSSVPNDTNGIQTESPTRYLLVGILTVLALIGLCVGGSYVLGTSLAGRTVSATPTHVPGSDAKVDPTGAISIGSSFSIHGAGFQPNETVEIFAGPSADAPFTSFVKLGDAQSGPDGTFTKDGLVAPTTPGRQVLLAKGSATGFTQSTPIEILGTQPVPTTAPPGGPLPNLAIVGVRIELQTGGACINTSSPLGIRVDIQNNGGAPAGPFAVQINDQLTLVEIGLPQGQTVSRWLPGYLTGANRIIIDPSNAIQESNRDDNQFNQLVAVPTQPAPCSPAPGPATAVPPGTPTPNPDANGAWYGQYFGNQDLTPPVLYDQNFNNLNSNWASNTPGPNVPRNGWSAIFVRNENFPSTDNYQFTLTVDGGARVFIDNQRIPDADAWFNGGLRTVAFSRGISAGSHTIRVEYYKSGATARLALNWKVGYSGWVGRYYNNQNREGQPVLKRDDADINFDWGFNPPAPEVNADNFSVDWQRTIALNGGQYMFTVDVDDGVRVLIDGQIVPGLDSYSVQGNRTLTATRNLSAGPHFFEVQYVEYTGQAKIKFRYDPIVGPTATPTPVPPASITPVPVTVIVMTNTPLPATPTPAPMASNTPPPAATATFTPPPLPTATFTPAPPTITFTPPPLPTATFTPAPPTFTPTPPLPSATPTLVLTLTAIVATP